MFDITPGVYRINTRSTARFLSSRQYGGINLRIQFGGNQEFGWNIIDNLDGTTSFEDYISGQYLEAVEYTSSGSTLLGVTLATRNPSEDKQAWYIEEVLDPEVRLKSKHYNKYLTALNEEDGVPPPPYENNFDYKYHARTDTIGDSSLEDYIEQDNQIWRISKVTFEPIEGFTFPHIGFALFQEKIILFASSTPVSDQGFTIIGPQDLTGTMEYLGQYVEPNKNIDFLHHYYKIDVTQLEQVGNYKVSSNSFEDEFIIGNDIYSTIRGEHGFVTFRDFINGFWANNKITEAHVIDESIASDTVAPGATPARPFVTLTGNSFTVTSGWFDAHSRDTKIAREALNLYTVCYAAFETTNIDDKQVLVDFITYTASSILHYQNNDGSWPIGKVRRYDNSSLYSWAINLDTGNVAKAVRSLAISYQIIKDYNTTLANDILNASYNGWNYIENHSNADDFLGSWMDFTYTGTTIDIIGAAVEMFIATGDSVFKDYCDYMISNSSFRNGLWRYDLSDMYVKESNNPVEELWSLAILSYKRYYSVASPSLQSILEDNMKSYIDYWNNRNTSPYDVDVRQLSNIGRSRIYAAISYVAIYIYDEIEYESALSLATKNFNWIVGFNPLFESAITRVGRDASAYMFKRPFHRSAGALIPSITINQTDSPITPTMNFGSPNSSEATVLSSSLVFGLFIMMDKVYGQVNEASITMAKSSDKNIVNISDTITYTTIITNNGTLVVNGVVFIDLPPDGTQFITGSVTIDGVTDTNANPSVGINLGSINPTDNIEVSFMVRLVQVVDLQITNISNASFEYQLTPSDPIENGTAQSNSVTILINHLQVTINSKQSFHKCEFFK